MCTGLKTHSHQAESAVGQPVPTTGAAAHRSIWSVLPPISLNSTLRPRRTAVIWSRPCLRRAWPGRLRR